MYLKEFESPSPNNALCQVLLNWSSGSVEEDEHMDSLRRRQRQSTDTF